jgi:RHS repeat-associated protein
MVTLAYNDAGQIISVTRSNGVVTQYTYDADGRVASITESSGDSTIASTTIKRNAAGRIVGTDQNVPQFNDPAPGILQLGYDAAEQVAGAAYDGLGRLNADALRNYTWDMASRMTGYSGADGSATATYDDAGLRVSRTGADGTTLNHIWNYATPLPTVATVQSGGADLRYYVYTPDGTLLYSIEASDGSRHFYHFDQSGSTLFLTDDGGNITDTYAITPFGESVAHSGSTDNPFTWLGQFGAMQEGGTSLFYLRARYYDSATARFLSRDPLRANDPRQINPYQYAADNPVTSDDATGLRVNNRLALDWARSMTNYNYSCYFDSRSISSRYRISPERLKSLGLPGDDSEGESGGTPWTRRSIPMAGAWQRGTDGGGGGSRDSKAPPFDRALDLSKIQFGGAADSDSSGLRSLQRALANSPWSGRE